MNLKIIPYLMFIISLITLISSVNNQEVTSDDYRQKMRNFVIGISTYAKTKKAEENKAFYVIPQNGIQLILTGEKDDTNRRIDTNYLQAIDGNGQESLFYGGRRIDYIKTAKRTTNSLISLLDISKSCGKKILVTDYCQKENRVDNSNNKNQKKNYTSFAANERDLTTIPSYPNIIPSENDSVIEHLSQVKNFLYLIELTEFDSMKSFIKSVTATNYDLLITDVFFNDKDYSFTKVEVEKLRKKDNGGKRLVIAYMSIGEAETYRYYWEKNWKVGNPKWLDKENKRWEGNFKVKYWEPEWQKYIYGNESAYLDRILALGFDGVYLDIVDGFQYYEK